jgi:hypothetical protein
MARTSQFPTPLSRLIFPILTQAPQIALRLALLEGHSPNI